MHRLPREHLARQDFDGQPASSFIPDKQAKACAIRDPGLPAARRLDPGLRRGDGKGNVGPLHPAAILEPSDFVVGKHGSDPLVIDRQVVGRDYVAPLA